MRPYIGQVIESCPISNTEHRSLLKLRRVAYALLEMRSNADAVSFAAFRACHCREHEFDKRIKAKELKPQSEIVVVEVPPLIDRETFDTVRRGSRRAIPRCRLRAWSATPHS